MNEVGTETLITVWMIIPGTNGTPGKISTE
jgi:hypothetical protein